MASPWEAEAPAAGASPLVTAGDLTDSWMSTGPSYFLARQLTCVWKDIQIWLISREDSLRCCRRYVRCAAFSSLCRRATLRLFDVFPVDSV